MLLILKGMNNEKWLEKYLKIINNIIEMERDITKDCNYDTLSSLIYVFIL